MYFKKVLESDIGNFSVDLDKIEEGNVAIARAISEESTEAFNNLIKIALTQFRLTYPWLDAVGDGMCTGGYFHVVVDLQKTCNTFPRISERLVDSEVPHYPFLSSGVDVRDSLFDIIYILSDNKSVSIVFPGSYDKTPMSVRKGGLLIYPSCFGFSPLLQVKSNLGYLEYIKGSIFLSNPPLNDSN